MKIRRGDPPWNEYVVVSDEFMVNVICDLPGGQTDRHYHLSDECWFVAEGKIIWQFENNRSVEAGPGDFILAPKNAFHLIRPAGDGPSIRLAISTAAATHLHERK